MGNPNRLIICKLGNFYVPALERKLSFVFQDAVEVYFQHEYIQIGDPDYVIGDYIREYSVEYLSSKIEQNVSRNPSDITIALINQPIEKNYFSHIITDSRISIITADEIEGFNIDIDTYFLLGVVEHYIAHSKKHNWHHEQRRCIFDFCSDKKNITASSLYLALCDDCKSAIGLDGQELINKAKTAMENNFLNFKNSKLSVFISYSHKDEGTKEKLDVALSALKRSEKILTWNDRKITPGTEWDEKIKSELSNADIILLLISADFLASDYIWNIEIKKAIERHENKEAVVIPIFCRSCDFTDMPFANIQGLPNDAKPLNSFDDIDAGLTLVSKGIRKVIDEFNGV
jgi:hypothetical protein